MNRGSAEEPMISIWFGNFYRPAYDDKDFIREAVQSIRAWGFTAVELDSKAWLDFQQRFEGGEASPYVAQQEFMMEEIREAGLSHWFLALYLNGDNLYPNIRFSPPVYGESVQNADGTDGRWYKYWSARAQDSMARHVDGLMRRYGTGNTRIWHDGRERLPLCSMWDPIAAPSFDEEGQRRYKAWLQKQYGGIEAWNAAYQSSFASFDELPPEAYWFPERYGENACYTLADLRDQTPDFVMWADNMRWRADELQLRRAHSAACATFAGKQ